MAKWSPRAMPRVDLDTRIGAWTATTADAAPAPAEEDDPLARLMAEIIRDLAADGVLITHQPDGDAPVVLFADGVCRSGIAGEPEPRLPAVAVAGEWHDYADGTDTSVLTTSVPTRGGTVTVKAVFRRMVGEAARANVKVVSARLLPLLSPFTRLWWQRRRAQRRVRDLTQAIDRADIGIVLLDRQGRPTFSNAAARGMIEEGDGLRMTGPMLSGRALGDTMRLQAAIEHAIAGPGATADAPVIGLPRATRRPLLAATVAAEGGAILYLFDPEQDLCALIEPACKLYGLSPVETRLTCLLADGASLADAAATMRVREMTARSYLKQIFVKTDTNRQAELVWLMLKSTVRTRAPQASAAVPVLA